MSAPASTAGKVVSLAGHGSYRPDFRGVAASHVRAARERLHMDHATFAGYLSGVVGWTILAEAEARWEQGSAAPPGDVALAADWLLGDEARPVDLLASVPPAFPAQALAGWWVTCYDFPHAGRRLYHADVARIAAESDCRVRVTNHSPSPRTDGRVFPFRNEIEAQLASRHLTGQWRNVSDTRYFGALQLAVLPGETVMDGWYTGFASDISVSEGRWKWVRLDTEDMPRLTLREPSVLHGLIAERSQDDAPLALADIGEEA